MSNKKIWQLTCEFYKMLTISQIKFGKSDLSFVLAISWQGQCKSSYSHLLTWACHQDKMDNLLLM